MYQQTADDQDGSSDSSDQYLQAFDFLRPGKLWEADDWLPERWRFFELPASVVASADFRVLRRVFVFDLLLAEVPDVFFFCSGI